MLARDQLGQILPLLRLIAVAADLVDAEVGMRAVGQAYRRRRPRKLLDRDAVLEIAEPASAILLLDGDAVQAELADPGPEIARELIALVGVGGFAEIEIEHPMRVGNHGAAASGWTTTCRAQPYSLPMRLSRAEKCREC